MFYSTGQAPEEDMQMLLFVKIRNPHINFVPDFYFQYCCVLNEIKLVLWDGVENHLEKLPTHPMKDKAIDIVSTATDCFVVFVTGSIQVSML
jgi:hypothetical protein